MPKNKEKQVELLSYIRDRLSIENFEIKNEDVSVQTLNKEIRNITKLQKSNRKSEHEIAVTDLLQKGSFSSIALKSGCSESHLCKVCEKPIAKVTDRSLMSELRKEELKAFGLQDNMSLQLPSKSMLGRDS